MKKIRLVMLALTLVALALVRIATLEFGGSGTMNIGAGIAEAAQGLREGITKDLSAPSPEEPRQ